MLAKASQRQQRSKQLLKEFSPMVLTAALHILVILSAVFLMSVAPALVLIRLRPHDEPEDVSPSKTTSPVH
jgi:ABC-type transport system involved in cytochrome bd biosynthesis fused ATPase/permease subunit